MNGKNQSHGRIALPDQAAEKNANTSVQHSFAAFVALPSKDNPTKLTVKKDPGELCFSRGFLKDPRGGGMGISQAGKRCGLKKGTDWTTSRGPPAGPESNDTQNQTKKCQRWLSWNFSADKLRQKKT